MEADTTSDRWFYKGPAGKRGPVSRRELLQRLAERTIPAESPVWHEGMEAWRPAVELAELRIAGFAEPAAAQPSGGRGIRRLLPLVAVLGIMACVVAAVMTRPPRSIPMQPRSPRERLIAIGRSADLESMPVVIDAIVDPDAAVASTAVIVAESLLGVRYSDSDRKNPKTLAGKVAADWKMTKDQMRRRLARKESIAP